MLKKILKAYAQKRQWHTNRKIVVFESDDWGSTRIPDHATFQRLIPRVPGIEKDYYAAFDALESSEDLERLFETLRPHKDANNNPPIITANTIMANPDYKKIKASGFTEYHYEPFYDSILRLKGEKVISLWKQGMDHKLFHPQFHGREHLLVPVWMKELQQDNKVLHAAFEEGVFSVPVLSSFYQKRKNLQAAFDYSLVENIKNFQEEAITEGMKIFKEYFGFTSKSFIASAYIWNRVIEKTLLETGIKYIQGLPVQYEPKSGSNKYIKRFHYTGQVNKLGQVYIVRNVFFEPSSDPGMDWVGDCMERINRSFGNNSPVIVGVHRVNFIGSLVPSNREKNLALFNTLLGKIVSKWPDVEFMSTDQLGNLILESK